MSRKDSKKTDGELERLKAENKRLKAEIKRVINIAAKVIVHKDQQHIKQYELAMKFAQIQNDQLAEYFSAYLGGVKGRVKGSIANQAKTEQKRSELITIYMETVLDKNYWPEEEPKVYKAARKHAGSEIDKKYPEDKPYSPHTLRQYLLRPTPENIEKMFNRIED